MSKRCELQKEYYKEFGNYKGVGKYSDHYVNWLESKIFSISLPDYEYEMFIDDEVTPFEINSWIPIATDRIKDVSRINEYIKKGLIRKRQ